jgi:hypothetical protein
MILYYYQIWNCGTRERKRFSHATGNIPPFRDKWILFSININASCRFGQAAMWLITTRKQITTPAWWVCVLYKYSKYNSKVESIGAVCVFKKARNAFKRFDREMLNQLGNSLNALKGPRDFIFFSFPSLFLWWGRGYLLSLVYFQLTKECVYLFVKLG